MFGVHPFFMLWLLIIGLVLLALAFAAGWAFRKGWDRAGRDGGPTAGDPHTT